MRVPLRFAKILVFFVFSIGTYVSSADAFGSCARVKISSGTTCRDLSKDTLKFDLSGCGDDAAGDPDIKCRGNNATASLKGKKHTYEVDLSVGDAGFGVQHWKADSAVRVDGAEANKTASNGNDKNDKKAVAAKGSDAVPQEHHHRHAADQAGGSAPAPAPAGATTAAPAGATTAAPAVATTAASGEAAKPAEAAPAAAPTPPPVFNAYIDMYYAVNMNAPKQTLTALPQASYQGVPGAQDTYHAFDIYSNQFSLALVELTASKTIDDVAFKVDFDFGPVADLTHTNAKRGVDEASKNIGQANMTWTPSNFKGLTVMAGKMPTHMGWEVTKAKDNWQYSRSFLFAYAIPVWHSGLSLGYAVVPDKFTTTLFVYNGNNTLYSNNDNKTLGLQLNFTPVENSNITYNLIAGPEGDADNKDSTMINEVIAVYPLTEKVSVAADFVMGTAANQTVPTSKKPTAAHWTGFSLALKWQVRDNFYLSPRVETYSDTQGFTTGTKQALTSLTLTGSRKINGGIEARLELRMDSSNEPVFLKGKKKTKSQVLAELGLLYAL